MTDSYEEKYNALLRYIGHRDNLIINAARECAKITIPNAESSRRYHSEHLHEVVSLLLDCQAEVLKQNTELKKELEQEQIRAKMWQDACHELTKDTEE